VTGLPFVTGLVCMKCGRSYRRGLDGPCPRCGPEGVLDVGFDLARVRSSLRPARLAARARSVWRYRELLPVPAGASVPPLEPGFTPIAQAPRLAEWAGLRTLLLKDEGRNPTGSFKDRASVVGVARALVRRARVVACASTGNAASSLAGAAASVGMPCVIFVPESAPEPKVAQLLVFGARVLRVRGSYDETWELCQRACAAYGWYNRNAAVNPSLVEGKKTCGLEIGEQCGRAVPDWVAVSVGDGCTIAGIWKGLQEMHALGFIPRRPRLLGVQAEGARPLVDAFRSGGELVPGPAATLADSICVGHPRNWRKALRAVRESGGTLLAVPDVAILEAMRETGRRAGVFGEPAGVAGLAGLRRAVEDGIVGRREAALAVVTGSGLKDVRSAIRAAGEPVSLPPDDDALAEHLHERPL
jgi:threonine synthase